MFILKYTLGGRLFKYLDKKYDNPSLFALTISITALVVSILAFADFMLRN